MSFEFVLFSPEIHGPRHEDTAADVSSLGDVFPVPGSLGLETQDAEHLVYPNGRHGLAGPWAS